MPCFTLLLRYGAFEFGGFRILFYLVQERVWKNIPAICMSTLRYILPKFGYCSLLRRPHPEKKLHKLCHTSCRGIFWGALQDIKACKLRRALQRKLQIPVLDREIPGKRRTFEKKQMLLYGVTRGDKLTAKHIDKTTVNFGMKRYSETLLRGLSHKFQILKNRWLIHRLRL